MRRLVLCVCFLGRSDKFERSRLAQSYILAIKWYIFAVINGKGRSQRRVNDLPQKCTISHLPQCRKRWTHFPADPSPPPPPGTEYTSRNCHNFWTFYHHENRGKERKKGQVLIIITGDYASTIGFSNEHQNDKEKDNNAHIIIIPNDVFIIGNSNDHINWRRMITMIIIKLWSSWLWLSTRGLKFIYIYTADISFQYPRSSLWRSEIIIINPVLVLISLSFR